MKACRSLICFATVFAVAGVAFAAPTPSVDPGTRAALKMTMLNELSNNSNGSSAGIPRCESTGFEAVEALCAWEAGFGVCGSTFTCKNTCTDGLYPTTCIGPPTIQPDNCCNTNPHPVNEWYMSATSQHCQSPSISSAHPASGAQHMRFEPRADGGGNGADLSCGCVGQNVECRQTIFTNQQNPGFPGTLFNPGVTTIAFDISRDVSSGVPGMGILYLPLTRQGSGGTAMNWLFDNFGYVFVYDYSVNAYIYAGGMVGGRYHNVRFEYDNCADTIIYYYDNVQVQVCTGSPPDQVCVDFVGSISGGTGPQGIEEAFWTASNAPGAIYDIDNYSVVRNLLDQPVCPTTCGADGNEPGEGCDPTGGGDDDCCPGLCGAPGTADECQCPDPANSIFDPTCPLNALEVFNGPNGPFISDGGLYKYTADAEFTSVDNCGSSDDSTLFWGLTPDCGQAADFNDDCLNSTYGGYQSPGDPNASCYGTFQSCVCAPTVPGTVYYFAFGVSGGAPQPAFCSTTFVNITKKTSCALGGPIPGGACCDQTTGMCTDGVEAAACADPFDVYSDNKLCTMVECAAIPGACCNTAPGAGGACVETLQADCPATQYQSWTPGVTCGDITCLEVTGSCCDGLTGSCSTTLQSQCGPASTWTEGGSCSTCVARTGACCVEPSVLEAICTEGQTLAQCNAAGGLWSDSQPCSAVECTPNFIPIPTVSEWGLAILALMLLIGGKIYFSRREAAMA